MPASEPNWDPLFQTLCQQPFQIALVCTGGGAGAIAKCFRRSGASCNFVDAAIPYSRAASDEYLGAPTNDSRASKEFAQRLASAAFARAIRLSEVDAPVAVGIGLVAVLPTLPANDVEERIHVAMHRQGDQQVWSTELEKGTQTRESAEAIADEMLLRALEYLVKP